MRPGFLPSSGENKAAPLKIQNGGAAEEFNAPARPVTKRRSASADEWDGPVPDLSERSEVSTVTNRNPAYNGGVAEPGLRR